MILSSSSLAAITLSDAVLLLVNTPSLKTLIQQQASFEDLMKHKCQTVLEQAYDAGDMEARYEVQHALFILNNLSIAAPESVAASNQFNPLLLTLKADIQERWLAFEFMRFPVLLPSQEDEIAHQLLELCQSHRASKHPIFDFFETSASPEQLDYFFKSDSALNILFFDLVAFMLPGSFHETRAEICKNLWDESGKGNPHHTHVDLYHYLLTQRKITLPEDHFTSLYSWQGYTGYNVFMLGATHRQHYYKSIGAMAMTELLDPPQYTKLVRGIKRIGMDEKHALYYTEHIEIDIDHADGWLNKVIKPLVKSNPSAAQDILYGAMLRLQSCADYYDGILMAVKK